ncbi:hypothetical protein UPYG_G00186430 [Umbra pygmaea]|uniref:Uncharacterized protein n=1 Tax=Umbra pygmaea TaxID=75934 RepID=A0ABD0XGY8_UMBPY
MIVSKTLATAKTEIESKAASLQVIVVRQQRAHRHQCWGQTDWQRQTGRDRLAETDWQRQGVSGMLSGPAAFRGLTLQDLPNVFPGYTGWLLTRWYSESSASGLY